MTVHRGANVGGARLDTRAPFHLEATARVLQRRPGNLVDVWWDDRYRRVFQTEDGLVLVEVENRGTIDVPDVRWRVRAGRPSSGTRAALARTIRDVLGLDVDPAPLRRRAEGEPRLRPTALALRGMRPPRFPELFEAFANVIPFQQLSLDAGAIIVARLVKRFGAGLEYEGRRLHAFPAAGAVALAPRSSLRACGLSLRKADALRRIAGAVDSGELSEGGLSRLGTAGALAILADLPGIGPWSAGLVLLRGLRRLDVFPPGDVGAERGLRTLLGQAERASLTPIVARFGDYRGYLYFCALGGSLIGKGLIRAAPPPGSTGRG